MAEQTAQDVVTETQSAGESSSADGLGSTQSAITTREEEEVAETQEAGPIENTISKERSDQNTPEEQNTAAEGREGHARDTEEQQTDAKVKEVLNPSQSLSSEIPVEAPPVKEDTGSVGDSISVQGSEEANHVGVDTSTTSDAEVAGKTEGSETKVASAIKKPAAFKSVSVTKNFLAKSGSGTPAATKLGDKLVSGAPKLALTSSLRPRLVAKAGRDIGPIGGTGTTGPNASSVWNRNKPVVPPPPKHYTDEELKQQYGIQLATRLGADQSGKDSKWADIDDEDEGDWVPESVQWVDGTKSTSLPEEPPPVAVTETIVPAQTAQATGDKPTEAVQTEPKPPSSSGKTILRPGARLVPITKPGLVLKSLPEKPVQEERPASTTTSKSPWAKLPAIEKASPINFDPPPPEPRQPPISNDAREVYRPDRFATISPAREIEPDTFRRTWRDSETGGNRELFNSQSGRYEPVKSSRRLSRPDSSLRPSSLLQRPSQGGAEQRDSIPDESASIRKSVSSRVDEESNLKHQTGIAPHQLRSPGENYPDALQASEDHQTDSTISSGGLPAADRTSNTPADQRAEPAPSTEDARAVQQRLMQERIAAARKRKQEEEAKEEAEKQKRIAARLAALEAKTAAASSQSEPLKEPSPQPTSKAETIATKPEEQAEAIAVANLPKAPSPERQDQATPNQTPSLPSSSKAQTVAPQPSPPKPEQHILQSPARTTIRSSDSTAPLGFASPSRRRFNAPSLSKSLSDPAVLESSSEEIQDLPGLGQLPEDRVSGNTHTWQNVSLPQVSEPALGWAANMARSKMHGGSVWGPLASDKSLGNGAFDRGQPHIQLSPQVNQTPSFVAEGSERVSAVSPGLSFDSMSNPAVSPQPNIQRSSDHQQHSFQPQQQSFTPPFMQPQSQVSGFRVNRPSPPIVQDQQRQNASRAWGEFNAAVERVDGDARETSRLDHLSNINDALRRPVASDYQPIYHETFRKTAPGQTLGQRRVVSVVKSVHEGGQSTINEVSSVQAPIGTPYGQSGHTHIPVNLPMSSTRIPSRFFGYGLERPNMNQSASPPESSMISGYTSLSPPPDSADHPVYGRSRHPLVHLPPPAPVVKLPPQPLRMVPTDDAPVVMPPRSFRPGVQPIVANADWQQRFNGLFGRPDPTQALSPQSNSSPVLLQPISTPAALPADSSSKPALEVSAGENVTRIVLPASRSGTAALKLNLTPEYTQIESKPTEAEEELWQDREFGSLPIIELPKANMWFYSDAATPFTQPAYNGRPSKLRQLEENEAFGSTVQLDSSLEDIASGSIEIVIKMLDRESKTVTLQGTPDKGSIARRARKFKDRTLRQKPATSQDISSDAPGGVENEKRPYKKTKRGSRGLGSSSPSVAAPNENAQGSVEGSFHGHARPPRASRGGFKKARGELSAA